MVLPIAYEFNPEFVLVCAGFDAAEGDRIVSSNESNEIIIEFIICRVGESSLFVPIHK